MRAKRIYPDCPPVGTPVRILWKRYAGQIANVRSIPQQPKCVEIQTDRGIIVLVGGEWELVKEPR